MTDPILNGQQEWIGEHLYDLALLSLCIWREARGEIVDTKRAVAWSIRNRVLHPSWWGTDWISVILKPKQYSSFNAGDPNSVKFPQSNDSSWVASLNAAMEAYSGASGTDPSRGATHYFDKSLDDNPPFWAKDGNMFKTADIGNLHFYRLAP
jgi:N-acetylmuramoyl-L-alanine amidase